MLDDERVGLNVGTYEMIADIDMFGLAVIRVVDREGPGTIVVSGENKRRQAANLELSEGLTKLGLRPVTSEANFVFMVVGPEAKALSDELLQMGVIVRPLGWMGFPEAIRISVGTAEENDKCLSAMAQVILKRAGKGELAAR